jgi:hypothetical protein
MNPSTSKSQSVMLGPVEHMKLSKIVSYVLRDLYPIRPPSINLRIELANKYNKDLKDWRANLSRFLDAEAIDSSLLIPLYQRQRNVLNLAYFHAVLLVHRPFLLSNFAHLAHIDARTGYVSNIDTSQNVLECLEAAMGIVRIVDELFQGSQIWRVFWFTQYYAFCAVVVLYIYRIQQHMIEPGNCEGYFSAGQRCQAQLSCLSANDHLSKRYVLVLEELRLEAARQTNQPHKHIHGTEPSPSNAMLLPTSTDATLSAAASNLQSQTPQSDASANNAFGTNFYGSIPTPDSSGYSNAFLPNNNFMADLTSWGQFDSLVTGGIGVLDGALQGDPGFGMSFGR